MIYPYSTATGTIHKILTKIQTVGLPATADKKWLASIGFTKSSEQRVLIVLKFIGFIDEKNVPTELWNQFRSPKTGKKILGSALKEGYKELYEIYPNAHELENEELNHFFTTRTNAGPLALSHTINTFKNMATFAEFDESIIKSHDTKNNTETKKETTASGKNNPQIEEVLNKTITTNKDVSININIQLTVPETTNEVVYQKFFEAMKKYLLS